MFSKLAAKNVGRSVKDYGVWFLTIVFAVCLFYVFNALETQAVFQYLGSGPTAPTAQAIRELVGMLSIFVWVVLAFLILYASGFLIRRRKKELGTYLLLGMGRGQVARLLLLETAGMGLLALLVGLGLGVLAAWGLSAFTAGLFAVPMTMFTFSVSLSSLGKTALAFAAIFLLVMAYHAFAVSRCRLIDLMQAQRVNQELKSQSLGLSVVLFLAGAALLAIAYAMLLTRGILRVDALFWVMIGLGSLGTLLFFRSLSGFLLRVCRSRKKLYYKNLNMFVLRQFNARINTTYRRRRSSPRTPIWCSTPPGRSRQTYPPCWRRGASIRRPTALSISPSRCFARRLGRPLPSRSMTPLPAAGARRRRTPS